MLARQAGRLSLPAALGRMLRVEQRAQTGKGAAHIATLWRPRQHAGDGTQQEVDFFGERLRIIW